LKRQPVTFHVKYDFALVAISPLSDMSHRKRKSLTTSNLREINLTDSKNGKNGYHVLRNVICKYHYFRLYVYVNVYMHSAFTSHSMASPVLNKHNLMRHTSACEDAGAVFISCYGDGAIFSSKIHEMRIRRGW